MNLLKDRSMETLQSRKFSFAIVKVLYLLLPFIISLLVLFPGTIFAAESVNIILPGGKSPKFNIRNTNNTKYISLKDFKNSFLPEYDFAEKYVLENNKHYIVFSPSSFFICSIVQDDQSIVQLNAPTYEAGDDLFIPITNLVANLEILKLYKSIEENDGVTYLKKIESLNSEDKIEIKKFDFSENIPDFDFKSNPLDNNNVTPTYSVTNEDNTQSDIISGEKIIEKSVDNSINEKPFAESKANSVSSIFKNNIQSSKDAFMALEPSKNQVIYLETAIKIPKILKKESGKELKKEEQKFPPNVYVLPKGLVRRGIDKN